MEMMRSKKTGNGASITRAHAMQTVSMDAYRFDVLAQWEDGRIGRPIIVGLLDVFTRKICAHRIGELENAPLARMAFADLIRDYGIPSDVVMDNGRAFASALLSGDVPTRFRFKVMDTGVGEAMIAHGVRVHRATPNMSGLIERTWRHLCLAIETHPAVAGAYTGNRPDAKPENYRERAIPVAEFRAHAARQIVAHNAVSAPPGCNC
ncbi:transposase domain-containing protein [Sphingomonas oryzagri]